MNNINQTDFQIDIDILYSYLLNYEILESNNRNIIFMTLKLVLLVLISYIEIIIHNNFYNQTKISMYLI